jgi:hypothetical protein
MIATVSLRVDSMYRVASKSITRTQSTQIGSHVHRIEAGLGQ